MKKVLYTSAEIRKEIGQLFSSSKGRRVAISAFVGNGAEAYLRKPEGLVLICWPKAGGTNPNALRELINRGVDVYFADALHMKMYWTEDCGAIITSANLSTNALGAGDLREIGVRLSSKDVDVDRIISFIKPRPVTSVELRELDRRHKRHVARSGFTVSSNVKRKTFDEWYELGKLRDDWKLYQWEDYFDHSMIAQEIARKEYGVSTIHSSLSVQRGDYREDDWIFCFRTRKNSKMEFGWIYTHFIIRVPPSDKNAYDPACPYELVQPYTLRHYEPPPFQMDSRLRTAFAKTIYEYGLSRIENLKSSKPPTRFIDKVYRHYVS